MRVRRRNDSDLDDDDRRADVVPWAARYRFGWQSGMGMMPYPPFASFMPPAPQREMTYEEMLALDEKVKKPTRVDTNRLPTFAWNHDEAATKEMEPCSICLESFVRGQQTCILPCTHRYHVAELKQWFETSGKSTCPVCNAEVYGN